jgi:hypothetical protein
MSGTNEKSDAKIDFLQFKNLIIEMKTDIVNEIGGSLIELKKELALVQNSIRLLDEKQKIIENKIARFEKEKRRKNIVIKGIPELESDNIDLEKSVISFVNEKLHVEFENRDVDVMFRLGKPIKNENKPRHILVKLTAGRTKKKIMKNKLALKGSKFYIEDDHPKSTLTERYKTRQQIKTNARKIPESSEKTGKNNGQTSPKTRATPQPAPTK